MSSTPADQVVLAAATQKAERAAPPRQGRLSDGVAAELQRLILEQEFAWDERLPSEGELCKLFGVSRTVIREAVRSLASKGLLEVRRGGGTTVRLPDERHAAEMLTIMLRASGAVAFKLVHEVRSLLEVEIASLAAQRRTDTDLRELEYRLEATLATEERDAWARADVEFHQALAAATKNPLYPVLLNSMAEMLLELRLMAARLPDTPARGHAFHSRIVEAVRGGSRTDARRAMADHMAEAAATYAKARLLQAFGES